MLAGVPSNLPTLPPGIDTSMKLFFPSFARIAILGMALASCRKDPVADPESAPAAANEISRLASLVPRLPGFLANEGVSVLGFTNDTAFYAREIVVHVALPDSVRLRNWEHFQDVYRRLSRVMDGKGRFVLSDRMRKVRLEFDLSESRLEVQDSTGYFLPPRPPVFAQGSDRIRKTPNDAGAYVEEPGANGTYQGVRCNALQDVNGRLYYNMSGFSFQVDDEETLTGHTASSPPHLVDAVTGEIWNPSLENIWTRGEGTKLRLLYAFPDTLARNWSVVASQCTDDGYFWQYHPYTRRLERISLESLETVFSELLPPDIKGRVVSIHENSAPTDSGYQALILVRDAERFTVLRSKSDTMFAQRWDPPQPQDTRYVFLGSGSLPGRFSLDGKDYDIDRIDWQDLSHR